MVSAHLGSYFVYTKIALYKERYMLNLLGCLILLRRTPCAQSTNAQLARLRVHGYLKHADTVFFHDPRKCWPTLELFYKLSPPIGRYPNEVFLLGLRWNLNYNSFFRFQSLCFRFAVIQGNNSQYPF